MISRPALVAEGLLDFLQFADDDHAAQLRLRAQDLQVLGDHALNLREFIEDLLLLHAGQALELQFDDRLRLPFAEVEDGAIDVAAASRRRPVTVGRSAVRVVRVARQTRARFLRGLRRRGSTR